MLRKNKTLIVCLIFILIAVIISIIPDIYRLIISPSGITYPLLHNNGQDYFYYLSLMRQGYEGNWLITTRMTPESFPKTFAQTFFALLGHIARISSLSLEWIYFLSRIILGGTLLFASLFLSNKLFTEIQSHNKNKYLLLSCLFVSFGTGFWTISIINQQVVINSFLPFWTRLNPILKTTYLPHHLLSTILGLISIIFLSDALDNRKIKTAIISGILGAISGFIYFATMINILGAVTIAFVLKKSYSFIRSWKHKRPRINVDLSEIIILSIYFSLSTLSLFYLLYLASNIFPWSTYDKAGQNFTFIITPMEYIGYLGPLLFLVMLSIPFILSSRRYLLFILLSWIIFPFVGIFIITPYYSKFGNVYFLEATSYIPIGILAVLGFRKLEIILRNQKLITVNILAVFLIIYFIPPILYSIYFELHAFPTYYYNIYIPNDALDGIKWLSKNSRNGQIVLAGGYFGNIIPAFTSNRVVYGHPKNTYDSAKKSSDINIFFSQKDKNQALSILKKYNVSYIFFSLDTDRPNNEFINSLGLKKVYENQKAIIFRNNLNIQ